jgi:hypothetical protein
MVNQKNVSRWLRLNVEPLSRQDGKEEQQLVQGLPPEQPLPHSAKPTAPIRVILLFSFGQLLVALNFMINGGHIQRRSELFDGRTTVATATMSMLITSLIE